FELVLPSQVQGWVNQPMPDREQLSYSKMHLRRSFPATGERTQIFRQATRRPSRRCSREDSNLHGLPHTVLSRTRLPVPPRELKKRRREADLCARAVQPQLAATLFARPAFQRLRL